MIAVLVVFGILVGIALGVILPWVLLRKLEAPDQEEEDR